MTRFGDVSQQSDYFPDDLSWQRAAMANARRRVQPTQARPCLIPIAPAISMGVLDGKDGGLTVIYTHVLNRGGRGVRSPADVLAQERPQPGARRKQPNAPEDSR